MTNKIKATMIVKGGMGNVIVKHIWLIGHGRMKYAQYNSAPFITWIDKGARTKKSSVYAYNPYLVILNGWQDIKTQDMFNAPVASATEGVKISTAKYSSFGHRWTEDFENATALTDIIADYRGVNSMEIINE